MVFWVSPGESRNWRIPGLTRKNARLLLSSGPAPQGYLGVIMATPGAGSSHAAGVPYSYCPADDEITQLPDGPLLTRDDAAMKLPRQGRENEAVRPTWRPISAWWWMIAAAFAVLIIALVVTTWLLAIASGANPGTDRANARLDAVRTGLAAGAGAGAAVGLMLAFRRQHHQEIATVLTDLDAAERRITELYTKAVDQLGNDKAPVRLGGLYALERLAEDNSAHRQTIVNVICAYLRMPFPPMAPAGTPAAEASEDPQSRPAELATGTETAAAAGGDDTWQQERQVRVTAQRILAEHLRNDQAKGRHPSGPSSKRFWPGIRLDLTGATLIDFRLEGGVMADANFTGATFTGDAEFTGATFTGYAVFRGATFARFAVFDEATFTRGAVFDDATVTEDAMFGDATFTGDAVFMRTMFNGDAGFGGATFNDDAAFIGVIFNREASFRGVTFYGIAGLVGTTFAGEAWFNGAAFMRHALFSTAAFTGGADALNFEQARVLSSCDPHVWPTGWCLGPDDDDGYTVVRSNDDDPS